jgi:hypothetical protein
VSVANRMTVERAKRVLEEYDVHLVEDQWLPTEEDRRGYCPTGLYMLEIWGYLGSENPPSDITGFSGLADADAQQTVVLGRIAHEADVSFDYLLGLNNGFVSTHYWVKVTEDVSEEYKQGVMDGQALRVLTPKESNNE